MANHSAQPTLETLPRELRNQIYSFVFQSLSSCPATFYDSDDFVLRASYPYTSFRTLLPHLPSLCQVSKCLYTEATPCFFATRTLASVDAVSTEYLMDWLGSFDGNDGYRAVRRLKFQGLDGEWGRESVSWKLVKRCTGLRELSIVFKRLPHPNVSQETCGLQLLDNAQVGNNSEEVSTQPLAASLMHTYIDTYGLEKIFAVPCLEVLHVRFQDVEGAVEEYRVPWFLKAWLVNRWVQLGRVRTLKVDVRHDDPLTRKETAFYGFD